MAITGRLQLGRNWSDIETAQVLRGQSVVVHGLFRYIRHPIYVGDLLLLLGLELSLNSWLVMAVVFMMPGVLRQAVHEERMLVDALPGYEAYCARTKRFLPFIV
jgi:protein-S-isoprenylcysteine O-methyltransferase Ste14